MSDKDPNHDELDDLSPFLRKMRKRPGEAFSTPPRYFEQLEDAAWKRVQAEQKTAKKPLESGFWASLWARLFRPSYALGALGMVAIVVTTTLLLQRRTGNGATTDFLALADAISDEELYEYVDENEADFDTETLIENLQDTDADYIPSVSETLLPVDTSAPKTIVQTNTNPQEDPTNTQPAATAEQLLEGITAEELLEFLDEEGLLDDLLEDE